MKLDDMITWCTKQKKGIRIEKPNNELCKSYIKEANDSILSMNANIKAGLRKWAIITAYYARYNSIYALLTKIGIKCEIHDCSITLMRYLFSEKFDSGFFDELEKSKQHRIDMQYYTNKTISVNEYEKDIESAADFVLKIEEVVNKIRNEEIEAVRKKIID